MGGVKIMENNMKYFKNKTGDVFVYTQTQLDTVANIDNPDYEFPIPQAFYEMKEKLKDMVELTGDEIEEYLNPIVPKEVVESNKRLERDNIINNFSWRLDRNSQELELGLETTDKRIELLEYMQYLRDIPNEEGFPYNTIKTYDEFLELQSGDDES